MKKIAAEFFRRGLVASSMGPLILAALYLILQYQGVLQMLAVHEVCLGIFSLWGLAFVAGGMNVIYQIERLPLMAAILIHGSVLYLSYLFTYLLNNWLEWDIAPIMVFSAIFILGYLVIWVFIYTLTKRHTEKLNAVLKEKQQKPAE